MREFFNLLINRVNKELIIYINDSQEVRKEKFQKHFDELTLMYNSKLETEDDLNKYYEKSILVFFLSNHFIFINGVNSDVNNLVFEDFVNPYEIIKFFKKCMEDLGGTKYETKVLLYYLHYLDFSKLLIKYYYPICSENVVNDYINSNKKYSNQIKQLSKEKTKNEIDFLINEYKKTKINYLKNNSSRLLLPKENQKEVSKEICKILFSICKMSKTIFIRVKKENFFLENKEINQITEIYDYSTYLIYSIYKKVLSKVQSGFIIERNKNIIKLEKRLLSYINDLKNLNCYYNKSSNYNDLVDNTNYIEDEIFIYHNINKMDKTVKIIKNAIKYINFLLLTEKDSKKLLILESQKEDYLILLNIMFSKYIK